MSKPSIRRHRTETGELGEGWDLTRPGFGFNTAASVINYSSYADARQAFLGSAPGSASQLVQVEVAGYAPGLRNWYRPRWIEASA